MQRRRQHQQQMLQMQMMRNETTGGSGGAGGVLFVGEVIGVVVVQGWTTDQIRWDRISDPAVGFAGLNLRMVQDRSGGKSRFFESW